MINITFPGGKCETILKGCYCRAIAHSISPGLRKKCVAAKINGHLYDLTRPIEADAKIELITNDRPEAWEIINHSAAHLMAAAIKRLYPDAKFGVGPAIEDGFYYDIDTEQKFQKLIYQLLKK